MCGNSSSTEQCLVTTKNDTGESRLALDALTTSTTVKGTTTNHAAVCVQSEVLMVRKTSCYRSCCFHHDQYILGCQGWTKHVLFPQSRPQLNQHTSRGEAGEDLHFQDVCLYPDNSYYCNFIMLQNEIVSTGYNTTNKPVLLIIPTYTCNLVIS